MLYFHSSIRELRRWALDNLSAGACALVELDGSVWSVEVFPDGEAFPLRALLTADVYQ